MPGRVEGHMPVIDIQSAQQRHKDRETLEAVRKQKENLRKVMEGLDRLERELERSLSGGAQ